MSTRYSESSRTSDTDDSLIVVVFPLLVARGWLITGQDSCLVGSINSRQAILMFSGDA